jgi:hypothetical protein
MLNSNFAVSVPANSGEDFLLSIIHSQYEDIEIVIDSECLSSCVNNQVSLPDLQERIVATPGYLPADDSNLVTTRESSYYKSSFGCIDSDPNPPADNRDFFSNICSSLSFHSRILVDTSCESETILIDSTYSLIFTTTFIYNVKYKCE